MAEKGWGLAKAHVLGRSTKSRLWGADAGSGEPESWADMDASSNCFLLTRGVGSEVVG